MTDEFGNAAPNPGGLEPIFGLNGVPDGFVLLLDAPDLETGEIICATLNSEGVSAVMQNPEIGPGLNTLPMFGNTWSHSIFVAPADLDAARQILAQPPPTEEELAAEQAADPTTLEQAEQRVRNA